MTYKTLIPLSTKNRDVTANFTQFRDGLQVLRVQKCLSQQGKPQRRLDRCGEEPGEPDGETDAQVEGIVDLQFANDSGVSDTVLFS